MQIFFNTAQLTCQRLTPPVFQGFKISKPDIFVHSNPDFLSLPQKDIIIRIQDALKNPKNKLGSGGEAVVWKIEDTGFCVKIPHKSMDGIFSHFSKDLTKEDKANHVVLKLGNNATVMPIIEGVSFGYDKDENEKIAKMVERMPVKSFVELFKQIKEAENESDVSFDPCYKNVIINSETQTMTAIDFYKSEDNLFKNEIFSRIFCSLSTKDSTTIGQLKKIAGKLILAALSIQKTNPEMNPFNSGFQRLLYLLKEDNLIENPNYIKILIKNAEILQETSSQNKIFAEKILITVVKQLFGVTPDSDSI